MERRELTRIAYILISLLIIWVAIIISSTNRLFLALVSCLCFVCFILGYAFGVPDIKEIRTVAINGKSLVDVTSKQTLAFTEEQHESSRLGISDKVDSVIENFVDQLLLDLVNVWFVPLCKSGETEFQACVKSTILYAIKQSYEIFISAGKDKWILLVYGLINALLLHYEEFKDFENSPLEFDIFSTQPERRRTYHESFVSESEHLRKTSMLLLKKLLPKHEGRSILVGSLLKEIIASGALFSIIEKISDPDFLNTQIVEAFTAKPQAAGVQVYTLNVIRGENLPASGLNFVEIKIDDQTIEKLSITSASMYWNVNASLKSILTLQLNFTDAENEEHEYSSTYLFSNCYMDKVLQVKLGKASVFVMVTYSEIEVRNEENHPLATRDNPMQNQKSIASEQVIERDFIDLDAAMQNNELFMEFMEYLNMIKAPPYLHFLMNVDALRQYTSISLNIDQRDGTLIANYFKGARLDPSRIELLSLIKSDATDVFANHFSEKAKYHIPLNPDIVAKIRDNIDESNLVTENSVFAGGPVGPDIFEPAYRWILKLLDEVYFPKFKETEAFARFLEFAEKKTLSFEVDHQSSHIENTSNGISDNDSKSKICKEITQLDAHFVGRLNSPTLIVFFSDLKETEISDSHKYLLVNFEDEKGPIFTIRKMISEFFTLHRKIFGPTIAIPDSLECEEVTKFIKTLISQAANTDPHALLDFINSGNAGGSFYMLQSSSSQRILGKETSDISGSSRRSTSRINLSEDTSRGSYIFSAEKSTALAHFNPSPSSGECLNPPSGPLLNEDDTDFVIESFFSLLVEVFDLKDPNQWFRRKLLAVFKQVLKQAYGESLSAVAEKKVKGIISEDFWAPKVNQLSNILYPDGIFIAKKEPPPPRTEDQKFMTMMEAKALLLENLPDLFVHLMGRYTVICGVGKLFNSFQNRAFNKAFIFSCIDIVMKIILSDSDS